LATTKASVSLCIVGPVGGARGPRANTGPTPPVTTPQPSAKNLHDWAASPPRIRAPSGGKSPAPPPRHVRTHRHAIGGRTSWETTTMGRPRCGPHIRGRPVVRQRDRRFFTTSTCNGATNPSRWQRVRFRWIGSACVGCATVAD
jgi:hypothetical protein